MAFHVSRNSLLCQTSKIEDKKVSKNWIEKADIESTTLDWSAFHNYLLNDIKKVT